jgi:hypothetical protein
MHSRPRIDFSSHNFAGSPTKLGFYLTHADWGDTEFVMSEPSGPSSAAKCRLEKNADPSASKLTAPAPFQRAKSFACNPVGSGYLSAFSHPPGFPVQTSGGE